MLRERDVELLKDEGRSHWHSKYYQRKRQLRTSSDHILSMLLRSQSARTVSGAMVVNVRRRIPIRFILLINDGGSPKIISPLMFQMFQMILFREII